MPGADWKRKLRDYRRFPASDSKDPWISGRGSAGSLRGRSGSKQLRWDHFGLSGIICHYHQPSGTWAVYPFCAVDSAYYDRVCTQYNRNWYSSGCNDRKTFLYRSWYRYCSWWDNDYWWQCKNLSGCYPWRAVYQRWSEAEKCKTSSYHWG